MLLVRCLYDLVCSFGLKAYSGLCWNSSKRFQKVCHDISAVWLLLLLPTFNARYVTVVSFIQHNQLGRVCTLRSDWNAILAIYVWQMFSWPLCKYIVSPTHHWWCSIAFNSIHGIGMFHNPRTVTTEFCSFQQLRSSHDRICMERNSSSCGLSHVLGNSMTLPQQEWGKSGTKCTV